MDQSVCQQTQLAKPLTRRREEILRHLDRPVDYLVLGVGTSGTVHDISRRLREAWPDMKVVGVDAVGSILFNTPSSS